jgi:hypothetical protein
MSAPSDASPLPPPAEGAIPGLPERPLRRTEELAPLEVPTCACGCGARIVGAARFCSGHNMRPTSGGAPLEAEEPRRRQPRCSRCRRRFCRASACSGDVASPLGRLVGQHINGQGAGPERTAALKAQIGGGRYVPFAELRRRIAR